MEDHTTIIRAGFDDKVTVICGKMNVSVVVNGSCAGDILRNSYPPAGGPASVGISSYPYGIEAALTDLWISGATAVFHRNDNH